MHAPVRPLRGRWPTTLEKLGERFFWNDPEVILSNDVSAEEFRRAMSAIHVGDTIKITGANRHPEADALLIDNVDLSTARIVDIGASDGSTSVDLIRKLPTFLSYTIADLFFHVFAVHVGPRTVFFDDADNCVLVRGPRALAWPSKSKAVTLAYSRIIASALRHTEREEILLLNPDARAVIRDDKRVDYRVHDVFRPWSGSAVNVIKVANLLRRLYFSDADILRALGSLMSSLSEGGYFLLVDNHRIRGLPPRAGLYQRQNGRFAPIARTENHPEIDDLVAQVAAPDAG